MNDRPVAINDTTAVVVATTLEGNLTSGGETVASLFNPRFTDPKDAGKPNGVDSMIGVVITASAANTAAEGTWQYSTNNGATWTAVPTGTSDASAIYLSSTATGAATNLVRFVPVNANYSGTPGQLTVRLVENDQAPAGGIIADVPNGAANGTTIGTGGLNTTPGTTSDIFGPVGGAAFAVGQLSNPLRVTTSVTPVSDAPVLTLGNPAGLEPANPLTTGAQSSPPSPAAGNDATQAVTGSVKGLEDTPIPLGISVAAADTSNPEAISTVTITGIPAGWVIKDGAGNDITAAAATGLTPAQLVNATITAPTDANSVGPAGTTPAATLTIVVTSQDGAAPAATTTGTLNVVVTPVNDAPLFTATTPTVLPAVNEDTTSPTVTVATAFPGFSDPKDAGKPNGQDTRVGVVLTGNAATPAQGSWQYSPDGGVTWVDVPRDLSDTNALYLPDTTQVRFIPALNFNGIPGNLTARLVEDDQAGANADLPANGTGTSFFDGVNTPLTVRVGVDLTTGGGVGGTSRVSANTRDLGISVTPVNDPPAVAAPAVELSVGDVPISFTGPNAITLSDVADFPAGNGPVVTVTITPTTNGRPFISALTPGVTAGPGSPVGSIPGTPGIPIVLTGTLADINATLLNLEYRSAAFYNGADSFTVTVNDNANGGPGPLQDTKTVLVNNLPLNDRPVVNGPVAPDYLQVLPGGSSPGRTVQDLFGPRFTDPRDAPTTNGGDVFAGIAIISTPPASQGTYQFSADGGATWIAIAPGTTTANAVVLAPNAQVRFVANPAFIGETTPLQAVLIETDQQSPKTADLLNRSGIPLDIPGSTAPVSGTIIDLSKLETSEAATTTNGIGRSRFSSLARPMSVGIRVDPPVVAQPVIPPANLLALLTPLPSVLDQALAGANSQFVGATLAQAQAEAAAQNAASNALFNSNLGNSGLQPNWLAPEGIPGNDPFTAPLPQPEIKPIEAAVPPPAPALPVEDAKANTVDCGKPRVVARPRAAGSAGRVAPRFAPGSEAAKRFSEQLKRARARAGC